MSSLPKGCFTAEITKHAENQLMKCPVLSASPTVSFFSAWLWPHGWSGREYFDDQEKHISEMLSFRVEGVPFGAIFTGLLGGGEKDAQDDLSAWHGRVERLLLGCSPSGATCQAERIAFSPWTGAIVFHAPLLINHLPGRDLHFFPAEGHIF